MNEWKALNGKRRVDADKQTAGVVQPGNRNEQKLEKQNLRTLMQAFHGCRKNCAECRQEETKFTEEITASEAEWEPKIEQKEVKRG